jgi:hypothetical protein
MRCIFLIAAALVFSPPSGAQQLVDRVVVDQIPREALDNSQVYRTFSHP